MRVLPGGSCSGVIFHTLPTMTGGKNKRSRSSTKTKSGTATKRHQATAQAPTVREAAPTAPGVGRGDTPSETSTTPPAPTGPPPARQPAPEGTNAFVLSRAPRSGGFLRLPPQAAAPSVTSPLTTDDSSEDPSLQWIAVSQKSGRMANNELLDRDIQQYVRYELFPKLKFITTDKQMNYSKDKKSVCGFISGAFGMHSGVDEEVAVSWWENHKKKILFVLNQKRADVTMGVKRAFLSKYADVWIDQTTGACCRLTCALFRKRPLPTSVLQRKMCPRWTSWPFYPEAGQRMNGFARTFSCL